MSADSFLDPDASLGCSTPAHPLSAGPIKAPQRLPPEVWARVAPHLVDDVLALLALRAVCSDCTDEVTPLAFRVVLFHDTHASVQRLRGLRAGGVVAHLFHHVRQARVLVRGARPPTPMAPTVPLLHGHAFAHRDELTPAPDLRRQTSDDAFICAYELWAAFDSYAWRALTRVDVVVAHAPAEATAAFVARALCGEHDFDVRVSDAAAPGYGLVLLVGEAAARLLVPGQGASMPAWLVKWQKEERLREERARGWPLIL